MNRRITLMTALAAALPATAGASPLDDGKKANNVLGHGDFTTGYDSGDALMGADMPSASTFFVPADLAYDSTNQRLFVADTHNHRFLILELSSGVTNGMAATYVLGQPDMATGGADPNEPYGNINSQNAHEGCTTSINGCGVRRAWALDYDPGADRIFAADPDNHRVLVWDLADGVADHMKATNVLGQGGFTTGDAFQSCEGKAKSPDACGMKYPWDVAYDAGDQRLFVVDGAANRVLVYDLSGGITDGMSASHVLGQPDFATTAANTACGGGSEGAVNACGLDDPDSVSWDAGSSRLFLSDSGNNRVLAYDLSGGITDGMSASSVLGQPDFTTGTRNTSCDGASSGIENVNRCGLGVWGAKVDYDANDDLLYVTDTGNHRVLAFDVAAIDDGEPAVGVLGQPDFVSGYEPMDDSYGGGTSRTRMFSPVGVTFDPVLDRMFVADGGNHRIFVYAAHVDGQPVNLGGNAVAASSTDNGDGTTTVTVTDDREKDYEVVFPAGTLPLAGNDEILVTVDSIGAGGPRIKVEADLPAGETKSITMDATRVSDVCIDDAEGADFALYGSWSCDADSFALPAADSCATEAVSGGHDVTICTSPDGSAVTLAGLRHTVVGLRYADPDLGQGPRGGREPGSFTPEGAPAGGGCSSGGGSGPAGLALSLLALALLRRRARTAS